MLTDTGRPGTVVVPVLTLTAPDGGTDLAATAGYARRASRTWIDLFLVNGSTTRGDRLTGAARAAVLDLWLTITGPSRLVACCWDPEDMAAATARGVVPMLVLQNLTDYGEAIEALGRLPAGALIYSHPMFTPTVFDAELARRARCRGVLPAGGKIAKVTPDGLRALRHAAGDAALWDGSSRHIAASLDAGASGVVATPLATFPEPFPARSVAAVQAAVDQIQSTLDTLGSRAHRTDLLLARGRAASSPDPPVRPAARTSGPAETGGSADQPPDRDADQDSDQDQPGRGKRRGGGRPSR